MIKQILLASTMVLSVTACGGSSTSGGSSSFGNLSTSQIENRGAALIEDFASLAPTTNMPGSAKATYTGVGASSRFNGTPQEILDTADSVFEVRAEVDFSDGEFIGQVTNARSLVPGVNFDGSLDVQGTISGNGFDGTYSGTITQSGSAVGRSIDVEYNGTITGTYLGDDAAAMIGTGQGTLRAAGFPGTLRNYTYWGAVK